MTERQTERKKEKMNKWEIKKKDKINKEIN